jgi:hypothetical protein
MTPNERQSIPLPGGNRLFAGTQEKYGENEELRLGELDGTGAATGLAGVGGVFYSMYADGGLSCNA